MDGDHESWLSLSPGGPWNTKGLPLLCYKWYQSPDNHSSLSRALETACMEDYTQKSSFYNAPFKHRHTEIDIFEVT